MSQVQQVKEATNIVEVIGERVTLQRSGTNFRGLCPFHSEKSPSFFVSDQLQRFRCFGCGESGDVFEFLQKYEAMTFAESLKSLADRAGITLEQVKFDQEDALRERLLEITSLAKEYFHYLLTKHEVGQAARDYLKNRGISNESIKLFQLGYALPNWDGLLFYLTKKKHFSLEEIEQTGLILKGRQGRYYDRFRDRLMFPLKNHRGQIVGFSGRSLDPNTKEAKYINTPETLLYHKSKMLFGFSELFQEIKKKREIMVVEGEFDVISSAQAHVNNIVAIKGSALTKEQIKLCERVADKVVLALDADQAGVKATKRAIELIHESTLELRVLDMRKVSPDKQPKDPDELSRNHPAVWREAVSKTISAYDFLLSVTLEKHNLQFPEEQRLVIQELAPMFKGIRSEVEKEFYLKKLAAALNVRESLVKADIEQINAGKKAVLTADPKPDQVVQRSFRQQLEEYILFLVFRFPEAERLAAFQEIKSVQFVTPLAHEVIQAIASVHQPNELQTTLGQLKDDQRQAVLDWQLNPKYLEHAEAIKVGEEWQQTLKSLEKEVLKDKIKDISQEISELDTKNELSAEEETKLTQLLFSLAELQKKAVTGA